MKTIDDLDFEVPLNIELTTTIQGHYLRKYGVGFGIPIDEESEECKRVKELQLKAYREAQPLIDNVLCVINKYTLQKKLIMKE